MMSFSRPYARSSLFLVELGLELFDLAGQEHRGLVDDAELGLQTPVDVRLGHRVGDVLGQARRRRQAGQLDEVGSPNRSGREALLNPRNAAIDRPLQGLGTQFR